MPGAINRTAFEEAYDWAKTIHRNVSTPDQLDIFGVTSINGLMIYYLENIADFDAGESYSLNSLLGRYGGAAAVEEQRSVVWGNKDVDDGLVIWAEQDVIYPV